MLKLNYVSVFPMNKLSWFNWGTNSDNECACVFCVCQFLTLENMVLVVFFVYLVYVFADLWKHINFQMEKNEIS